jgi:hypothetical protein
VKSLLAIAAVLMSSVTSAPAVVPAPVKPVSFSRDIVPVLRTQCATCHMTGKEAGSMALHPGAAYANLVNVKSPVVNLVRVVPGKPEKSYLIMKLNGTHLDQGGQGTRMPFGVPPLPKPVVDQITAWIKAGAKNN